MERQIPEGIEWPRYESGELVDFGDEYINAKGNVSTLRTIAIKDCRDRLGWDYYWKLGKGACAVVVKNGERIKRPPVLAADGEPLEVGQTVWTVDVGIKFEVHSIEGDTVWGSLDGDRTDDGLDPKSLTHQRPVLDADGLPIKVGDTVWYRGHSDPLGVKSVAVCVNGLDYVTAYSDYEGKVSAPAEFFTHTKPEPDSWSSVWADVSNGNETPEGMMRRCRALAERGE